VQNADQPVAEDPERLVEGGATGAVASSQRRTPGETVRAANAHR